MSQSDLPYNLSNCLLYNLRSCDLSQSVLSCNQNPFICHNLLPFRPLHFSLSHTSRQFMSLILRLRILLCRACNLAMFRYNWSAHNVHFSNSKSSSLNLYSQPWTSNSFFTYCCIFVHTLLCWLTSADNFLLHFVWFSVCLVASSQRGAALCLFSQQPFYPSVSFTR